MYKEKETQATSLQLSKDSTSTEVKTYFTKVFELKMSGKEFPVNLDEVWPLVYSRAGKAIASLVSNKNFIEGYDYHLHQKGKVVKYNELLNGIRIDVKRKEKIRRRALT